MSKLEPEKEIYNYLVKTGETLAVAESLTGGEISSRITNIPGISKYFLGGICAYANDVKINLLGVDSETIKNYGAVSDQCATEMLKGILHQTGANWGVATTGIAGPTGATSKKPLGLVYIAVGTKDMFSCEVFRFSGDRLQIKNQAVKKALEMLVHYFSGRKKLTFTELK